MFKMENNTEFKMAGLYQFRLNQLISHITNELQLGVTETTKKIANTQDEEKLTEYRNDLEILLKLQPVYKAVFDKIIEITSNIHSYEELDFANFLGRALYDVSKVVVADAIRESDLPVDEAVNKSINDFRIAFNEKNANK